VGDADFVPGLLEAFKHERDAHARLACARALCTHIPEESLDDLELLLADDSAAIRAEALARRYAARRDDTEAFTRMSQGTPSDREGVAHALSRVDVPQQGLLLDGLLKDASLEVRRAALRAAGRSYEPAHLPHVLAALDQRSLGKQAADVLEAWPASVSIPALENAARDGTTRRRRRIALSALGRVAHPDAVRALLSFIDDGSEDVRKVALRALLRQRARGADLASGRIKLLATARSEFMRAQWADLAALRVGTGNLSPSRTRIVTSELSFLAKKSEERLYGWLALVYPREDILRAQRTLIGNDRKARAFAFEILEQRLDGPLKRDVLPWLRGSPSERATLSEKALRLPGNARVRDVLLTSSELPARWLSVYLGFATYPNLEVPSMSVLETMFVLRTVELFSQLSSEELRAVAELAETAHYDAAAVIFREHDSGDALFILLRGEVEVSRDGKSVAVLSDGECFGELALLDRGVRSATVTARSACELARIRAEDFHDLLDEVPSIARAMLQILARRSTGMLNKAPG
jgi:HEAT repeat protein